MAKKKKSQPQEDLLDQLLDDVNHIAADPSLEDSPVEFDGATHSGAPPVGLAPDEHRVDATKVAGGVNPWDALDQAAVSPLDPGNFDHQENGLSPVDFPFQKEHDEDQKYQGPSAGGGYQSFDDLAAVVNPVSASPGFESAEGHENEATRALSSQEPSDRTASIHSPGAGPSVRTAGMDHEATVAADGFANRRSPKNDPQEKVVIGSLRGSRAGNVFTTMDASLAQAENLKMAQQRILDLEKENDSLRQENEEVSSAAEIIRNRLEEMTARITTLDREKKDIQESAQNEVMILKGNLLFKESEVAKARLKIDELDTRLRNDFKKIRVKERELENRLELARAEKAALVRAKDENILELKRKVDQLQSEIDNYREKCLELNKTIDASGEQFKRTVRALWLALSNLESKDDNLVPFKKAD
jgi:hypothetical protein